MESLGNIRIVVFDFFGTLARNGVEDWAPSLARIVEEQGFPFTAETLWTEWRKYEVTFRGSRTNMDDPPSSPPFRSYWEAWRDAFADTFATLGVSGDPDEAATICIDSHCTRNAFPEVTQALDALQAYPLAVLSNADDRFLDGSDITTLDYAKALIDAGYHPMTIYFPLVVHGALLVEPTEGESKQSLDHFIDTLEDLGQRAKAGDADFFHQAPKHTPRRRLDETAAARQPVLRWGDRG